MTMTFPVEFAIAGFKLSAHTALELLAYAAGFQLYRLQRQRLADPLDDLTRWRLLAAAAFGALFGARLLAWAADPAALAALPWWARPMAGKTIVGGLLGGTLGVELAKRGLGVTQRTGDVYALPLALAIVIGRVGCFLQGVSDHTAGTPSDLPWALDQGDGIPRHPAALYEAAGVALLGLWLWGRQRRGAFERGDLYRGFLLGYCALRFALEALKPYPRHLGLTLYQWACLGLIVAWRADLRRLFLPKTREDAHA
jgi:phosphatidylglycerol:prolipoprotein diacylglycerol transferase